MKTALQIVAGILGTLSFCGGLLFSFIVIDAVINGGVHINIIAKDTK